MRTLAAISLLSGFLLLGHPTQSQAGCGCDKPPPAPAAVIPNFAPGGTRVSFFSDGLQLGQQWTVTFQQGSRFDAAYREINLIGHRAEEACDQVDKLLDSAALAQVDRIRIIHGHGMGILKKAIAGLLANHPHVEKFYAATPEEGGSGATIVELKA